MKLFALLICALLSCSCATAYLYSDRSKMNTDVHYLAKGQQEVLLFDGRCYLDYNGTKFEAKGLNDKLGRFDSITFWLEDEKTIPNNYQVSKGDSFVYSDSIVKTDLEFDSLASITVEGKVAAFKGFRVKDMSLAGKIALTPFAFAADVIVGGALIVVVGAVQPETIVDVGNWAAGNKPRERSLPGAAP